MREIKFKAWWPFKKRWLTESETDFYPLRSLRGVATELIFVQYTGLKDRNGVEIYEGDIVTYYEATFIIKFTEGKFIGYHRKLEDLQEELVWSHIIGNIYENPEILNE